MGQTSVCECTTRVLQDDPCESGCSQWRLTMDDITGQHEALLERAGLTVDEFRARTDASCHSMCARPEGISRSGWHLLCFLDDAIRNTHT